MKRARAAQLILVNWNGVFYERYELNESVTALEGANGAGKTTVLIAAFIALLPDMKHLRFTNVGEHPGSAGERGIWGRLGETGRPSYAVLDIELASGERLVAGVHLERRSEPTIEPSPFLITDLPHETGLQDLLLVRGTEVEAVPEIEELRGQAARHGARLHRCATAREYFAELFERGVTPLRLEGDAERAKLAEMLRTSMTGGMSRVLTTGLREFLLKEERGLADTLRRMRSNMEACRRTRGEVNESRQLEQEISGVFEAGQEMFNAAVHATKEAAEEAARRTAQAEERLCIAAHEVTSCEATLKTSTHEHERATTRLRELDQVLEREQKSVSRLESAWSLKHNIERMEAELETELATKSWKRALGSREDIDALRKDLMDQRDQARDETRRWEKESRERQAERKQLLASGRAVSAEVAAISREVGGELLASRFEEISVVEAGVQEAKLGPLADAIVVDDPGEAATRVLDAANMPDSVWLVGPDAVRGAETQGEAVARVSATKVVVQSSEDVWRVTRVPDRPVLGRQARERQVVELEREAASATQKAEHHRHRQQELDGELRSVDELLSKVNRIEEERARLAGLGIPEVDQNAITNARGQLTERERERGAADRSSRELERRLGTLATKLEHAKENLAKAEEALRLDRAVSEPANRRWEALRVEASDLLAPATTAATVERLEGRGSVNLNRDALSWANKLQERLAHAGDGPDVAETVSKLCAQEDRSGEDYLRTWREVRDWLHRRLPAQIAQMDDPLEALARLRNHLADLEMNLKKQERDLQGDSAGMANAIGTHTRQARSTIARLNDDLKEVRFGSIEGVRLQIRAVPEMSKILDALRQGEAQGALFRADMPLEEALDELFKRHGGRRTQGHKLLDYREYIDPRVEVRRKADAGWELANPSRISTGESIGIGAALMMVVLTAWERDASLFRARRAHGTLRLLLLDEANRLDRTNLGVLFDLCQSLDLQLLVAAPEVAQAEGNTTYRLTRGEDENGREEVRVSGRRMVASEAA